MENERNKDAVPAETELRSIDWEEYTRLCRLIARRAKESFSPELVVGIAHGGVIVGATVASILHRDMFPIKFSRRVNARVLRKRFKVLVPPTAELKGKRVLLVDDSSNTGETLKEAMAQIKKFKPAAVFTAVLVRRGEFQPDSYAVYSKNHVVFPWQNENSTNRGR